MSDAQGQIERLRGALARRRGITEKPMFGGICFMLRDHMLAGSSKRGFMFRVGTAQEPAALAHAGTTRMEMNGREYQGFVRADPQRCKDDDMRALLTLAVDYIGTLPAKKPRAVARTTPRKASRKRVKRSR